HATPERPGDWPFGATVPLRYRWLFRSTVLQVERLSPSLQTESGFYGLFVAASALALFLSTLTFDLLLRRLGFSIGHTTLGVVLYLTSFPILFAYDMPIHTREDLLENACFSLALVAVVADRPALTVLATFLAANVREMGLLAALPFWFCSKRSRAVRASVVGASTLLTCLVTSIVDRTPSVPWFLDHRKWAPQGYETTLHAPLEGALYVFVCFGALWVAAFLGAARRRARLGDAYRADLLDAGGAAPPRDPPASQASLPSGGSPESLARSARSDLLGFPQAAICVTLALVSSIALGQVREVRTVYLAFPFVIPLALEYLTTDFVRDMQLPRARVAAGVVVALGGIFLTFVAWSPTHIPTEHTVTFVDRFREYFGESFQPGFQAPATYRDEAGEELLVWGYTASPWNGVHLVFHAALVAAIIAARGGRFFARQDSR
ncbi:MAG TPA: hypothetical protein VFF73_09145, partial [Planctomycetota bacterium]|nr:hypothetical protein [Planctomycetota bacterium]